MKKILSITILTLAFTNVMAQERSVQQSTASVQVGLLGIWVNHELKLSNSSVLRNEIGLVQGFSGDNPDLPGFGFYTAYEIRSIQLITEPRWYYNIKKRDEKGKNVIGNAGNYLSLKIRYIPESLAFSSSRELTVPASVSIIPVIGLKRSIGQRINFEFGGGFGYHKFFKSGDEYYESDKAFNLAFRFGYRIL